LRPMPMHQDAFEHKRNVAGFDSRHTFFPRPREARERPTIYFRDLFSLDYIFWTFVA
jgi:hypothetical protein